MLQFVAFRFANVVQYLCMFVGFCPSAFWPLLDFVCCAFLPFVPFDVRLLVFFARSLLRGRHFFIDSACRWISRVKLKINVTGGRRPGPRMEIFLDSLLCWFSQKVSKAKSPPRRQPQWRSSFTSCGNDRHN